MANNYLEFSEVIPCLTAEEEAWLRSQLQCVYVFGSQEFTEDELPSGLHGEDADWYGCRAWRDLQGYDPDDGELFGFAYEFHDDHDTPDAWGRHLWLHAEEWANVEQLVHLAQKFLRQFRPQDCWSLTYARTCSKPRVGEFGGGAVFVTADEVKWENAYDFVEEERHALSENRGRRQETERLIQQAEENGVQPEQLDELVHESASSHAASINNGGLSEQIEYLVKELGAAEVQRILFGPDR